MCSDCLDDDALHEASDELNHGAPKQEPHTYIYACKVNEVPKNGSRGKVVIAEHDEIALFFLNEKIYAISNICPHQASPLLSEGYIDKEDCTVACPLHGWTYRIDTGEAVMGTGRVTTYEVKIIDDEIWVEEPMKPEGPPVIWDDDLY